MRSFKDITADEEAHALALHKEAVVIDASLVGYTDYVGEDLWVDDLLGGGITASNATVCMGTQLGEALRELKGYHSWAKRRGPRRRASTLSYSAPRTASSLRGPLTFSR